MNKKLSLGHYLYEVLYMDKKSVSASLLIVYLAALFAVVGSCFYNFIFKERQIKIENVLVEASANISVFN